VLESDEIDVADTEDEVQTLNAVQHLRDSLEDIRAILDGAVDGARSIMEEARGAGPPFFILSSKKLSYTRQK
jgi:phosphoglycolate phosphatase-like HAD superfamily hydrolase